MTVFVFGNSDLAADSLPLRILPRLQALLPSVDFRVANPNEEWDIPRQVVVVDTVVGISQVSVFEGLEKFSAAPRVTMHDFDALSNLRLLQKLGKLDKVTVIGVPPAMDEAKAAAEVVAALEKISNR
ncbi:MAG: hypothetical protein Q7S23_05790 [bacterium]|nr:hypothetical protein [bacterium]